MIKTDKNKEKLLRKLKELFQLDQPDLDFGFYRIMQSRKEEITRFIDEELLGYIREAFESVDEDRLSHLKAELDKELKLAKDYGAPDPENTPKVIEAKAKLEAAKNTGNIEADIYDHLYRFFERYYEGGDFISRRYYTRETDSKAAAYAIPYSGEEVMLHWANKDQYYVKSSDYFTNYRFNLSEAVKKHEVKIKTEQQELDFTDGDLPEGLFATFKIVDADESDHGNIKTSDSDKRFFIISENNPLALISENELEIYFEYRSDPEKGSSQEGTWRDNKNKEAIDLIFASLTKLPEAKHFLQGFEMLLPTDSNKTRTLLEKYIYQYTSRNNRDFFIHKDLGSFLRRELDFYIKNEVMHLDDIEEASAPKAEEYLAKLKVIRKIAHKLIDFLAQLENFQKKLWLKKKFVVDTNYCITLDRVPKSLYPAICQNQTQREEWITLFAIDEIEGDALKEGYSEPLSIKFLEDNQSLVLDTKHFDESFKDELISSIDDFDEQCDGLLIHSENFQALRLLQERYREQVKCVYIDPPYNTGKDGFIYKDSYEDSAWLAFLGQTTNQVPNLLRKSATFFTSIDDRQQAVLRVLFDSIFSYENRLDRGLVIWNNAGSTKGFTKIVKNHEYVLAYGKSTEDVISLYGFNCDPNELSVIDERLQIQRSPKNPLAQITFPAGLKIEDKTVKSIHGPINPGTNQIDIVKGEMIFVDGVLLDDVVLEASFPYKNQMIEFFENLGTDKKTYDTKGQEWIEVYFKASGVPYYKKTRNTKIMSSILNNLLPDTSFTLNDVLPKNNFNNPKPVNLLNELLVYFSTSSDVCLDYFAGSGTTGHAVINRNRLDFHKRKYILVEIADYFNTVLKPRIQKVIYSEAWKDGKPENRETGISHCFKYIRLESYEDTLNNLSLVKDAEQSTIIESNRALKEDYMLNYFLDVESRGSLLNTDAFIEPMNYSMKIKKAGSDEQVLHKIDLIETFNYLIGLRVIHIDKVQRLDADFLRERDPELPHDQKTKLILDGGIKESANGKWWIRKIEGWIPLNPYSPNDGQMEKVLIVWRNLTGNMEEDNLILDSWFERNRISPRDFEFDVIYVNGSNNLPNLLKEGETWKVRLIEEEFLKAMWASKA